MEDEQISEYMKNRVRLTPETLSEKYVGLFLGMPVLLVLNIGCIWGIAYVLMQQMSEQAGTIAGWRDIAFAGTVLVWLLTVVFNLGDIGNGALCTTGRAIMPLAKLIPIGKWLRRMAHDRARQDPRAYYQKYLDRQREREARAAERTAREHLDGLEYSLPWKRMSDPFKLRRVLQIALTISEIGFFLLVLFVLWHFAPMFGDGIVVKAFRVFFVGLGVFLVLTAIVITAVLLLQNRLHDIQVDQADWLLSRLRRLK
ncbi:hypothetical protein [Rhizobium sp. AB2/73]|uniref:hypothetical protein n=1 Tax=Rhizobium sp. AB2/73 TaxID=2795216 RepID=UPI000DE07BB4|nr:hypothetical protein [Rhizobium sp. AB2/73]QYA17513.1 hypothetical protein J5284_34185 [Rhizobium sp. AB2/73]UEQ85834.1 hypothetical protein I8E17_34165 [Rhizobium sp. AB2/73]